MTGTDLGRQAEGTLTFLAVVMDWEGIERGEAVRRLLAYGEVVYRTVRLQRSQVVLRSMEDVERVLMIDGHGNPVECDAAPLMWMRPLWSTVACAFLGVGAPASLDPLEPIQQCGRWPASDLVQDDKAERCQACLRSAKRWR
jgi:hypothetical protein